jgi:predicted nuclease with TOPRIM domain
MRDTDPVADLWLHAMRAEIDALVLRFEAQLKQHVATSNAMRDQDHATLQSAVASAQNTLKEHQRTAESLTQRLAERDQEIATLRNTLDVLRRERDEAVTVAATLRADVTSLGARVQSLDEQFVHEKSFVVALLAAANTGIFEATQTSSGIAIEHSPQCYGAIKARKAESILALAMRERGRTVARIQLTQDERIALSAMADAAGCQLIEVQVGQRFSSATMEKTATRVEPADEDHVLECLMPGLRMAETTGAVVHPRVVVATGLDHNTF